MPRHTVKLATQSPRYARLLASAKDSASRRRGFTRILTRIRDTQRYEGAVSA